MVRKIVFGCMMICFALSVSAQGNLRELSFMTAIKADAPPVIDGKLSDECWKKAVFNKNYYEYIKPNPKRVKLKTECAVMYDDNGVYVGIVNFDDDTSKLKQTIIKNHNGEIWKDDSAEIYFDPTATGIPFFCFVVNSLGKYNDFYRMDQANIRYDWNGVGVKAAASVEKDRWTLELFVPWADFGAKAVPGSMWTFNHNRFKFGSGNLLCSSAPCASFYSADKFGFLYFSDGKPLDSMKIAGLIKKKLPGLWGLELGGDEVMIHDEKGIHIEKITKSRDQEVAKANALYEQCVKLASDNKMNGFLKDLAKVREQLDKEIAAYDGSFAGIKSFIDIQKSLEAILWKIKIEMLITSK